MVDADKDEDGSYIMDDLYDYALEKTTKTMFSVPKKEKGA